MKRCFQLCPLSLIVLFIFLRPTGSSAVTAAEFRDTNPEVLLKLGNFYLQKKDTKTAVTYYHRLIPKLVTARDYPHLGLVYYKLARIARSQHKYSETLILGQRSVGYFDMAGDQVKIVDALNFLGVTYGDLGFPEKSIGYHLRALKIAEAQQNYQAMAIMLVNLSGIRGPAHTAEFLYRALDAIKNVKDDTARGYIFNTLGMYFFQAGKYDSALYYYNISLQARRGARDYQGISFTLNNLGELYFAQGNQREAILHYDEALRIARFIDDPLSMCIAYGSLAVYYKRYRNERMWFEMMSKNLELSRQLQFKEQELSGLKNIADYYAEQNKPREALMYFRLFDSLKDTLFEEKRQQALAEAQTRYELAVKEKEIFKLQSDNDIKNSRIQRNRVIIFSMIVVIIFITTGAWFLISTYRDKLKAYKELVRKDMEIIKKEQSDAPGGLTATLPAIRLNTPASAPTAKSMMHNGIPDELQERLYAHLLQIMKVEKRFLAPDLSLADLARELNTNTSYLSRIINDRAAQNFSQFLNEYRIREARRLLSDPAYGNLSIEGIAQTVGFNSKSAFNTAFKAKTGVTPSFYQQSARRINSPELPATRVSSEQQGQNYPA